MDNMDYECPHKVAIPPTKPFLKSLATTLKETFFPDDPFRQFRSQSPSRKLVMGLQYFVPILEWAPRYTFDSFKADLIAGITIASLAVPQGISYAKLASLPPIIGLCECHYIRTIVVTYIVTLYICFSSYLLPSSVSLISPSCSRKTIFP